MKTFNIILKIVLLFSAALEFALAQVNNFVLPKPGECGILNEQYLYNEKTQPEVDEYPWFGLIKFKNLRDDITVFKCGAVLISKRHLLANAGCFQNKNMFEPNEVWLGKTVSNTTANCERSGDCEVRGDDAEQMYEIEEISLHPNYTSKTQPKQNDVAVLTLTADVRFTAHVRPICLPPSDVKANYVAQYLPYAGFLGPTVEKIKTVGHVLSPRLCLDITDRNVTVAAQYVCVKCEDCKRFVSGSALMGVAVVNEEPRYFYLVGLLSQGIRLTNESAFIFTAVVPYLNWIMYNAV